MPVGWPAGGRSEWPGQPELAHTIAYYSWLTLNVIIVGFVVIQMMMMTTTIIMIICFILSARACPHHHQPPHHFDHPFIPPWQQLYAAKVTKLAKYYFFSSSLSSHLLRLPPGNYCCRSVVEFDSTTRNKLKKQRKRNWIKIAKLNAIWIKQQWN